MARRKRKGGGPATFLIIAFILGTILGAVASSTVLQGRGSLLLSSGEVHTRSIAVVGISDGVGKLATLTVELRPGSGHLGIAVPPYEDQEAQASAVVARTAAETTTGHKLDRVDILISFDNLPERTTVTGPSSSASIALLLLATINASLGRSPNMVRQDVVVSASINEIGRLEPVGNILEKYRAVVEDGSYAVFVVSRDQTFDSGSLAKVSVEKAVDLNELAEIVLR